MAIRPPRKEAVMKKFYYNIMVNGYREHLLAPNCKSEKEAKKYAEKRKKAVQLMFDGMIPMDDKVSDWIRKKDIKEDRIITVNRLCNALLDDYLEKENKTYSKAVTHTNFFKEFYGEETNIEKIDTFAIRKMKQALKARKTKHGKNIDNATINRYMSSLRRAFNILKEDGKIQYNPCDLFKKDKETPQKCDIIPATAIKEFLIKMKAPQRHIVELDYNLGFRIGNILKLKKSQINLETQMITIEKKDNKGKKLIKKKINSKAMKIIKMYWNSNNTEYLIINKKTGKPYTRILKGIKRVARDMNLGYVLQKSLRKSFGTNFYLQTRDLKKTQEALDHSSPTTTDLYIEINKLEVGESIDKLANIY